jgi:DNA-3-methyladenine glycosylase II
MYLKHFEKDRKLYNIIVEQLEPVPLTNNIMHKLINSIMSQQLSTKVADILQQRFATLIGKKKILPNHVLAFSVLEIKAIGLSNQKAQYITNVAQFFLDNKISDKKLHTLNNQEVIDMLTQIKGVGKWTVEMLLMFGLGREDVFSPGDYGIQVAIKKVYNLHHLEGKALIQKMEDLALKWHPYQSYACRHLWLYKDGE